MKVFLVRPKLWETMSGRPICSRVSRPSLPIRLVLLWRGGSSGGHHHRDQGQLRGTNDVLRVHAADAAGVQGRRPRGYRLVMAGSYVH